MFLTQPLKTVDPQLEAAGTSSDDACDGRTLPGVEKVLPAALWPACFHISKPLALVRGLANFFLRPLTRSRRADLLASAPCSQPGVDRDGFGYVARGR